MHPSTSFTGGEAFSKQEKLCSRKVFGMLLEKGEKINQFPFRMIFLATPIEENVPAQTAFAVPKRNFKKAVDRNRIKRLMREVYRKNKAIHYPLIQSAGKQFALLFVYNGNKLPDYIVTEEKLKLLLQRFAEINKNAAE